MRQMQGQVAELHATGSEQPPSTAHSRPRRSRNRRLLCWKRKKPERTTQAAHIRRAGVRSGKCLCIVSRRSFVAERLPALIAVWPRVRRPAGARDETDRSSHRTRSARSRNSPAPEIESAAPEHPEENGIPAQSAPAGNEDATHEAAARKDTSLLSIICMPSPQATARWKRKSSTRRSTTLRLCPSMRWPTTKMSTI